MMALEIPLTYDREQHEYWPPFEKQDFGKLSPMVHFKCVYQLEHRASYSYQVFNSWLLAQLLQFKFSLEDESIFVYSKSCAYVPNCNQNQSLAYFQPSRSRSFTTNDHLFDGSIRGRLGPTGKIGRDFLNLNGFNSTTEFGVVDRSAFPIQADGVFGLGLIADTQRFQRTFLYQLLRAVPFPQVGFTVWPNRNLSVSNSGLMIVGQELTVGCVNDYQYVFLQYPQKQWIFAIKHVQYDSIFLSTNQHWTTSIQPGRSYTIAPDVFLSSFYSYIRAIQLDSRIDDYYVMDSEDAGPPMPDVTFEVGALQLTLTPRDYLSEKTTS
ncbi:hypothetical protein M3Y98_00195800 [Aphelenchoides besseyi]|nr:hypothetical protein M3Y98_00195800 [Aphelenchoides besseyi]